MKRRRSSTSHTMGSRQSTSILRLSLTAALLLAVVLVAALSLRFPLPARLMPLLRTLSNQPHGLAEQAPLETARAGQLRTLLESVPAGFAPMGHLLARQTVAFEPPRSPGLRAQEARAILTRAHASEIVEAVPGDDRLLSLRQTIDPLTGVSFRRDVLILLPGESVRIGMAPEKGSQSLEVRVGCLAATADRLDAPALGTLVSATGESRPFEVSPRGENTLVALQGTATESVTLQWPATSPGFLVVEAWRDRSVMADPSSVSGKGLFLFSIDELLLEENANALPKTHAALEKIYGPGNVAAFSRVMPSSTDADVALSTLFSGGQANGLFSQAAKRGLPPLATTIEPGEPPPANANSAPNSAEGSASLFQPEALFSGGGPLAIVNFPRRTELRNAVREALAAQDWHRPTFGVLRVRFPDQALSPTWRTARAAGLGDLPRRMAAGLGHSVGVPLDFRLAAQEKSSQIDEALSSVLREASIAGDHDFALLVVRREDSGRRDDGRPVPPKPGFLWFASDAWQGEAPRSEKLVALEEMHGAFAALVGDGARQQALGALRASVAAGEPHTVTESAQGTWHLFPYGKVLVPGRSGGASNTLASDAPAAVWDVPLDRTRETQKAILAHKTGRKERIVHVYFPASRRQERVSASLQWPLEPVSCAVVPGQGQTAAQARGVVEKAEKNDRGLSRGYRLWITAVADPAYGVHMICGFQGNARASAEVEMHFERGSQTLALTRVGLGEFALPIPVLEEGVQLAQTQYGGLEELLAAEFQPSWEGLSGYGVFLWEDPSPGHAFVGTAAMELRRRDKETEEEKLLQESSRPSGARFAEDKL